DEAVLEEDHVGAGRGGGREEEAGREEGGAHEVLLLLFPPSIVFAPGGRRQGRVEAGPRRDHNTVGKRKKERCREGRRGAACPPFVRRPVVRCAVPIRFRCAYC